MTVVHLVAIVISSISLLLLNEAEATSMTKPGCREKCGNVSIIYPFGIGKGCYLDKDFEVMCKTSSNTLPYPVIRPYPRVENFEVEVLYMSLDLLRIRDWTSQICYTNFTDGTSTYARIFFESMESFSYSHAQNNFIAIGCDIYAYIGNYNATSYNSSPSSILKNYISGCVSVCHSQGWSRPSRTNYSCSGIGCCQATFPDDLSSFEIIVGNMSTWPDHGDWPSNQCSLVLIAEKSFSEFYEFDVSPSSMNKTYFYPAILNWGIGNNSCYEARRKGDYVCGSNSRCVNSRKGSGYSCQCKSGYTGNPYLQVGCIGIYIFLHS